MVRESQAGPANSALEQATSATRPWQAAQGKTVARGGPRPGTRPPPLIAGVKPWSKERRVR